MKSKIISAVLAAVLAFSAVLTFTGCGDKNYPVEVANIKIEKQPESIVVLDASTADIISFLGYERCFVGRSDDVNQEWLSAATSFGPAANPDISGIKAANPDIVFASDTLSEGSRRLLEESGILVITMSQAKTPKQLETNYITLGRILGGSTDGTSEGTSAYKELLSEMDREKSKAATAAGSEILNTVCYLYLENDSLKLMTSGTYGDMLLSYTGAVNAAVNIEENRVDVNTLKVANPNFIFYADDATLDAIKRDGVLGQLTAVKKKKTLMVTSDEMNRQGETALLTLEKMISFMYPSLASNATSATVPDTTGTTSPSAEDSTSPQETTAPSDSASVADDYKIKLDKLSLKYEDENGNVKIMQRRLFDLGYITDDENVTGYYGDISRQAVKDFQKNNDLKANGTADNKTLTVLFSEGAVKAE